MAFVRPEEVVKNFDLKPEMVVADFGCGSGYYTIASARLVGDKGTVYAIDIQRNLLEAVKANAQINNLKNVEIIWADLEMPQASRLKDKTADFAIISNILFQAEKKETIAKEAFRILKDKGKAAVIEWQKSESKVGPEQEKRIPKEEAEKIFIQEGFKLEKEFEAGENHYGIIFVKREA